MKLPNTREGGRKRSRETVVTGDMLARGPGPSHPADPAVRQHMDKQRVSHRGLDGFTDVYPHGAVGSFKGSEIQSSIESGQEKPVSPRTQ